MKKHEKNMKKMKKRRAGIQPSFLSVI